MRRIRRILPVAVCVVAVTLLLGALFLLPDGFVRLAKSTVAQQLMLSNAYFLRGSGYFAESSETVDQLGKELGRTGLIASRPATPPLLGVWNHASNSLVNGKNTMLQWNDKVIEAIEKRGIRNVLLVGRWSVYVDGLPGNADPTLTMLRNNDQTNPTAGSACVHFEQSLLATVERLNRLGVHVRIVEQVPEHSFDPKRAFVKSAIFGSELARGVTQKEYQQKTRKTIQMLRAVQGPLVSLIELSPRFFDAHGESILGDSKGCYYIDDDHLSRRGADVMLRDDLRSVLELSQET